MATLITGLIVLAAAGAAIFILIKDKKSGKNCSSCSGCSCCHSKKCGEKQNKYSNHSS